MLIECLFYDLCLEFIQYSQGCLKRSYWNQWTVCSQNKRSERHSCSLNSSTVRDNVYIQSPCSESPSFPMVKHLGTRSLLEFFTSSGGFKWWSSISFDEIRVVGVNFREDSEVSVWRSDSIVVSFLISYSFLYSKYTSSSWGSIGVLGEFFFSSGIELFSVVPAEYGLGPCCK